jgi:DNA-directed RNA polymerase subunit RPC12/RpoP
MKKLVAMTVTSYGRCQDCGKPWLYTWFISKDSHFPLECTYCHHKAVLRIEKSELTPDDEITVYNEIVRRENKGE